MLPSLFLGILLVFLLARMLEWLAIPAAVVGQMMESLNSWMMAKIYVCVCVGGSSPKEEKHLVHAKWTMKICFQALSLKMQLAALSLGISMFSKCVGCWTTGEKQSTYPLCDIKRTSGAAGHPSLEAASCIWNELTPSEAFKHSLNKWWIPSSSHDWLRVALSNDKLTAQSS